MDDLIIYTPDNSVFFMRTDAEYGVFSNMHPKFPIMVGKQKVKSTEHLYQAMRFTHLPDIQRRVLGEDTAVKAKAASREHIKATRADWDEIKLKVMFWALRLKFCQYLDVMKPVFEKTIGKYIVEESYKDAEWGAVPNADKTEYHGINALGNLLEIIREHTLGGTLLSESAMMPHEIMGFKLLGLYVK